MSRQRSIRRRAGEATPGFLAEGGGSSTDSMHTDESMKEENVVIGFTGASNLGGILSLCTIILVILQVFYRYEKVYVKRMNNYQLSDYMISNDEID